MTAKTSSDLIFRVHSMYNYEKDAAEIIDLLRRCEATNHESVLMGDSRSSPILFHCESTDYLKCMKQYPESYCFTLVQPTNRRVVAIVIFHIKRIYHGPHTVTASFARFARVEPDQRRQKFGIELLTRMSEAEENSNVDYTLGYTTVTNIPSLGMTERFLGYQANPACYLNAYILPTRINSETTQLYRLTSSETEQLSMVDMIDLVQRPVLSDLHYIMQSSDYVGTFAIGDLSAKRYAAVMIWQPENAIISDDRSSTKDGYRGRFRIALNFFQSSASIDERENLLLAICHAAATDGIPFLLCHIQESSEFKPLLQQKALAMTRQMVSRIIQSQIKAHIVEKFVNSPIWLDPRDFGTLLYFTPLLERMQSQL